MLHSEDGHGEFVETVGLLTEEGPRKISEQADRRSILEIMRICSRVHKHHVSNPRSSATREGQSDVPTCSAECSIAQNTRCNSNVKRCRSPTGNL